MRRSAPDSRGTIPPAGPIPKSNAIKLAAGIAVSFAGLVGAIIFLLQTRMVSFEVAMLMLVALLAICLGIGLLVAVYRFVGKLE